MVGYACLGKGKVADHHACQVARIMTEQAAKGKFTQMLCEFDPSLGTHFVGSAEVISVCLSFGHSHDEHIGDKDTEDDPQPLHVRSLPAAVKSAKKNIDHFDRQHKRNNVH